MRVPCQITSNQYCSVQGFKFEKINRIWHFIVNKLIKWLWIKRMALLRRL